MKLIRFHALADMELADATYYYEYRGRDLGWTFVLEIDRALANIAEYPQIGSVYEDGPERMYVLANFPYTLFYSELGEDIWIWAVAHQKRAPNYWTRRPPG